MRGWPFVTSIALVPRPLVRPVQRRARTKAKSAYAGEIAVNFIVGIQRRSYLRNLGSREENMSRIDRRDFMKVTGAGGIALSAGAAHNLLTANGAKARGRGHSPR